MSWRIPLSDPGFGAEEEAAVLRVVRSGWISSGPEVAAFEREFAVVAGTRHAVAVSSATAALHLALIGFGIGDGDEIVQPALNFVAAANMTLAVGAIPVFADIRSLCEPVIDPAAVERLITPKTKAVIAMHYGGYLCDMSALREICSRHKLALIEDACHAVGAGKAGSLGDVGTFSFYGNKNLAAGEGGMLTSDSDVIAGRARALRSHGMTASGWDRSVGQTVGYDVVECGFNYRMDELRAALGRAQLKKLAANNARRRALVQTYQRALADSGLLIPFVEMPRDHSGHLMVVLSNDDSVRERLTAAGIQTSVHYPCICDFAAFRSFAGADVPLTRAFSKRAITLPLYPGLTEEAVAEICSILTR